MATLVARGVSEEEVLTAVNEEIGRIAGAEITALLRFEPDETLSLRAARGLEDLAIRSSVGVPIAVGGRVWGVAFAAWRRAEAVPDDAEARIATFAELVATALGSVQARTELQRLVAEHSALRRIAELVGRGADPAALFATVTAEASRLLGGRATTLLRAEGDGGYTVVAVCGDGPPASSRVAGGPESEGAPITVAGRLWGVLACGAGDRPLAAGAEARLHEFADLVTAALSTAEARAQLAASRARVLASADEARRRMQRDLHDGAQQRLVQTVISLKLARRALERGDDRLPALIDESLRHAELATNDLRDLVYGILPASLSRGGLRAGVETLVSGLPLPVTVDVTPRRLPGAVEITGYFVVAEALTNVVKHARATQAWVTAQDVAGVLWITVRDDGVGGATAGRGSGLTGLADRVEAAEGTLAMASPPGEGTALTVALPLPPGEESA